LVLRCFGCMDHATTVTSENSYVVFVRRFEADAEVVVNDGHINSACEFSETVRI